MITGIDLIQEQVRCAMGDKLRFKQEDIKLKVRALRPPSCMLQHHWR